MRKRANAIAVLAIAVLMAPPLRGQTIRGRLVDAVSHAPVASALTELRDGQGHIVQQTFSSPSGAFLFTAPANQQYQVRVAAIGYARHLPVDANTGDAPLVLPDIVLQPVVVSLPELRAMAGKRACGRSEVNAETFGGLLESANTSLRLMDATLRSAQLGFDVQMVHRIATLKLGRENKTGHDSIVSADTTARSIHSWPVRSVSLDSLQAVGFQREGTPAEGGGYFYYGPDLQVLFSDWFLDRHCFMLDKDRSNGDTVFIRFEPTGKVTHAEISGELVLDRTSLTLRRLTYAHRHLLNDIPDRSAGGEMQFAERSEGLWVPVDWAIWAPLTRVQRSISRPMLSAPGQRMSSGAARVVAASSGPPLVQVIGRDEQRGHLMRIVALGGG